MPSPFPGMNPYLERDVVWSDFHPSFCCAIKHGLVPQVQPEFYVKLSKHNYVHEESRRLPFREIFDKEDHTLVTVIELRCNFTA